VRHLIHIRTVRRAAEVAGGMTSLAARLGVSPLSVAAWMDGTSEVPAESFRKLVEIIVEQQRERLGSAIPTWEAEEFRYREAANS
jgi:DNA-binding transcriptional regulator YdaS (Cro superfamily)